MVKKKKEQLATVDFDYKGVKYTKGDKLKTKRLVEVNKLKEKLNGI